jgi:hypothetical protein
LVPGKLVVPFEAVYSLVQETETADACPLLPASSATEAITAKPKIRVLIRN